MFWSWWGLSFEWVRFIRKKRGGGYIWFMGLGVKAFRLFLRGLFKLVYLMGGGYAVWIIRQ